MRIWFLSNFSMCRQSFRSSRERMAFKKLSSKLRPTLMTSPVAFIWVESRFWASGNLSKGNRGILVTT